MRLIATVAALFVFCFGVLNAEEFWCSVKKVDGNKVTLNRSTKKEKVDDVTLTATDKCKVTKAHWNNDKKKWVAGDAIDGGLKSDVLSKLEGDGVRAIVITNKKKEIKEIRVHEKKNDQESK